MDRIASNPLKRIFDIFASGLILLVISPVMFIVAAAIKLSGEDVFFKQDRIGLGLKPFGVLKFTTMPKGSEKLGMLAPTGDKRVTELGKFLRKTKINELPQFINVFSGQMSMVGPRPLFGKQVAQYENQVQEAISKMRPGITGLGSLFFSAEDALLATVRDKERFYNTVVLPQKGRLELYYFDNWSFWLDVQIVFLTFLSVLQGKSNLPKRTWFLVEGFDEAVHSFQAADSK